LINSGKYKTSGDMLEKILLILIILSWIYWLIATLLVFHFFGQHKVTTKRPIPAVKPAYVPPISILKPVHGLDTEAFQNFLSFCHQDYPNYELLFGVDELDDPSVAVIEQLQRDNPKCSVRLMYAEPGGPNRKAQILQFLVEAAQNEVLVVSDSDMRVTPDYLRRVVAPLEQEQVGLVTCPYRGSFAHTLTAGLEALHMGVTFLPAVIVARRFLSMRFAMGATIVVRKADLNKVGGFASVRDYLADDYEIAIRIADTGKKIVLSDYIMVSVLGATTFADQWDREVRWSRCNRVNRPMEYPGYLLLFHVPMALALMVVSDASTLASQVLVTSLLFRWLTSWLIIARIGDIESQRWLIWLPVRDLLSVIVWFTGAFSHRVKWRGDTFLVSSDGRMFPTGSWLPEWLRRRFGGFP
jgi:ceramide glucosyltransferase